MRTNMSEILDLALTQAIERYMEMEPQAVRQTIAEEWPEQLAVLLVEFMFKATCGNRGGTPDFIHMERDTGDSSYIVPLCACDTDWIDILDMLPSAKADLFER